MINYDERLRIHSDVEIKLETLLVGSIFQGSQLSWMDCERRFTFLVQVPQEAVLEDFRVVLHNKTFNISGQNYKVCVCEDHWVGVQQRHDGTYEYLMHFVVTIKRR